MELKKEKEDLFKRKIQNAKQSGEAREGLFEQIFLDYQGKQEAQKVHKGKAATDEWI